MLKRREKTLATQSLIEKIKRRTATVLVVGLGHVGLPTAAVLANLGYDVVGVDIRKELLSEVFSGEADLKEPDLREIIEKVVKLGRFKAATDVKKAAKKADITMVSVQTPLTKAGKPNLSYLIKACEDLAQGLRKGKLIVVESTVPPGTIKNLVKMLEKESGLKLARDFLLAYCPERIMPGRILQELAESPRLIGGFDADSIRVASELFKNVTKGELLITDCGSAEVAKLAENTFRDVNIAFANELAQICEEVGVDVMEVIRLANTHPRVQIHKPGPGVGGPCLTKDPVLLLHTLDKKNTFESKVIVAGRQLNDSMPRHTVDLVVQGLQKVGRKVEESKIVVLGVAYKGDTDDASNSPSKEIIRIMKKMKADVWVYDPYCRESFGARKAKDIIKAVANADCLLIATDHKTFAELDFEKIKELMRQPPILVDGKRLLNPAKMKKEGFYYSGVGYGAHI